MVLSWTCHLHRIGSIVLLVHDFSDHWLELAKLGRYTKHQKICDTSFVMFAVTWVFTRLAYFPVIVIFSINEEAGQILQIFPAYYVFSFLLNLLLILHLIWGYFILKVAYKVKTSKSEETWSKIFISRLLLWKMKLATQGVSQILRMINAKKGDLQDFGS